MKCKCPYGNCHICRQNAKWDKAKIGATNMTTSQKKQAHTAGPWTYWTNDIGITAVGTKDETVCKVFVSSKSGNKALIASAPELLEACESALDFLRASGFGADVLRIKLDKAIAKAKGE